MPQSLRYIKELATAGINWTGLNLIDITSLIYSLRIDRARQYLNEQNRKALADKGYSSVRQATNEEVQFL